MSLPSLHAFSEELVKEGFAKDLAKTAFTPQLSSTLRTARTGLMKMKRPARKAVQAASPSFDVAGAAPGPMAAAARKARVNIQGILKQNAAKGRMSVAQSRKGRRPMSVSTMLRKEKEGTLYKKATTVSGIRKAVSESATDVTRLRQFAARMRREGIRLGGIETEAGRKRLAASSEADARIVLRPRLLRPSLRTESAWVKGKPARETHRARKVIKKHEGKEKRGYKLQGHTEVQGIPIAIENRKGSVRKGKNSDGTEWSTKFKAPYGYIKGTKGADGEEIDAYVGPDKDAPNAHVVHQHKDDGRGYDEDKVMLGFKTKSDAKKTFLQHYDDPKFLGPISTIRVDELKKKLEEKRKHTKLSSALPGVIPDTAQHMDMTGARQRQYLPRQEGKSGPDPQAQSSDVPSRDGRDPGQTKKREFRSENVMTIPGLIPDISSETGPMPRL